MKSIKSTYSFVAVASHRAALCAAGYSAHRVARGTDSGCRAADLQDRYLPRRRIVRPLRRKTKQTVSVHAEMDLAGEATMRMRQPPSDQILAIEQGKSSVSAER
jgi:hypothetical protein